MNTRPRMVPLVALSSLVMLVMSLAGVGCKKDAMPGEDGAPSAAPPPDTVLAVMDLPGGLNLPETTRLIDAVQPGFGALARGQASEMLIVDMKTVVKDTAMLDTSGRMWLILVATSDKPVSVLLATPKGEVVGASDDITVTKIGKRVAIGQTAVMNKDLIAYATELASSKVPVSSQLTGFPRPLLKRYRKDLEGLINDPGYAMALQQSGGFDLSALMKAYVDGIAAVGETTDSVTVSAVEIGGNTAVRLRIDATPGTMTAKLMAANKPSKFSVLEKLPGGASMALAGEFTAGPAREPLYNWMDEFMGAFMKSEGKPPPSFRGFYDAMKGDFAMAMSMRVQTVPPEMDISMVWGTDDPKTAEAEWMKWMKWMGDNSFEMMGLKPEITFTQGALTYEGATLHSQHSKFQSATLGGGKGQALPPVLPESISYFGLVDGYLAMAQGQTVPTVGTAPGSPEKSDTEARIKALVDAIHGKGPGPSAFSKSAADTARQAKASMFMAMDIGGLAGPAAASVPFKSVLMLIGFAGETATMDIVFAK